MNDIVMNGILNGIAAPVAQTKRRYELRVASVLGPGLVSSFGHATTAHAVSSHTLYQFCVPGDRDLIGILRTLRHCGVECVAIRQTPPPCPGSVEPPVAESAGRR